MKCSSKLTQLMILKNNVKLNHGSMTLKNTGSQTKTWFNDTQKHRQSNRNIMVQRLSKTQATKVKHHGSMTFKKTVKLKPGSMAHRVLGCHSQGSTFSQSGWHRYLLCKAIKAATTFGPQVYTMSMTTYRRTKIERAATVMQFTGHPFLHMQLPVKQSSQTTGEMQLETDSGLFP